MACNYPLDAYYSAELNPSGKRPLTFNPRLRYLGADTKYCDALKIGCGKCSGCKADQSLMWSIRAYHESQLHRQNSFVTLTYDDNHLPSDNLISKKTLQDFFKRLRKTTSIRYIACGEYGSCTRRPHYHAIIFGKDWLEEKIPVSDTLYTAPSLIKTWGLGHVSIAPVTMASICYTCGYVSKKIDDPDTFNLQSTRPGIGHAWLDKFKSDALFDGTVAIEGKSYVIPKRYLLWEEEFLSDVKAARVVAAKNSALSKDPVLNRLQRDNRELAIKARIKSKQEKL